MSEYRTWPRRRRGRGRVFWRGSRWRRDVADGDVDDDVEDSLERYELS